MTTYRVIDESGKIVLVGEQIVQADDLGNAVVVYEELCDLPGGEYTIQPGDISLEMTVYLVMGPYYLSGGGRSTAVESIWLTRTDADQRLAELEPGGEIKEVKVGTTGHLIGAWL